MTQVVQLAHLDSHDLSRNGLKVLLKECGWHDLHTFSMIERFETFVMQSRPALGIVNDSQLNRSLVALTRNLLLHHPDLRLLILTRRNQAQYLSALLEAGVRGILHLDDTDADSLNTAIRLLRRDGIYLSGGLNLFTHGQKVLSTPSPMLSLQELDILDLIEAGLRPSQISERLLISRRTVYRTTAEMRARFGAQTNAQLIAYMRDSLSVPDQND
jgi:DNA-binding NarL/FixJ family response regulator